MRDGNGEQGEAGKIKGERRRKKKVGERKSEEQERLVLSYRGRGPEKGGAEREGKNEVRTGLERRRRWGGSGLKSCR